MIKIFYGDDRVKARKMVGRLLGDDYEVIEAETVTRGDMDSIFLGTSLFGDKRKILIKSLSENKECWEVLPNYINTTHDIVILESNVDKRSATYKTLSKNKTIEFKEFRLAEDVDKTLVFDVFEAAYRGNGSKAVKLCESIETTNDPFRFTGLMVTQAFKKLELRERKAAATIKILGELDMATKSVAGVDAWTLIKAALLKIANI